MHFSVIVVGGGLAGLSAAIYLGRARRDTLVVDFGKSLARWEPEVENYLGFPEAISGTELLERARRQATRYHVRFARDEIISAHKAGDVFKLRGRRHDYSAHHLLLATGIYHIPPDFHGLKSCLGHSLFFCKDCDGFRVQGQRIAIYGTGNDAAEYALAMRVYACETMILTNGQRPAWTRFLARGIARHRIPVYRTPIKRAVRRGYQIQKILFCDGTDVEIGALFTTRGDIYHNKLADMLGATLHHGEITVNSHMRTNIKHLYAAGCVTPANCQMIIAAGQGAIAAQAINREIFMADLHNSLKESAGEKAKQIGLRTDYHSPREAE